MIPWTMDLIEINPEENAKFISNALTNRELLNLARGRSCIAPPTTKSIKYEIKTTPGVWYMIYVDKNTIGWTRLTPMDRWEAGLGIVIADPTYWNKGIGYSVCKAMLCNAFPIFHTVSWYTWDYNDASIMLAKKLGFRLVQTIPYCGYLTAAMIQENIRPMINYNGLKFIKGRLDDFNRIKKSEIDTSV